MANRPRPSNKRNASKRKVVNQPPYFGQNPIANIPRGKLLLIAQEIAHRATEQFSVSLKDIRSVITAFDPLQTLSMMIIYGLSKRVSNDGTYLDWGKNTKFLQPHVELLQALMLQIPADAVSTQPPHLSQIDGLFELLPKLGDAFAQRRMSHAGGEDTPENNAISMLQEHMRLHTQGVRNWGYFDDVRKLIDSLYGPLDKEFVDNLGISIRQLAAVFHEHIASVEDSIGRSREKMRLVYAQKSIPAMVEEYLREFPDIAGAADSILADFQHRECSLKQAKYFLLLHQEYRLASAFTMDVNHIAERLQLDSAQLRPILKQISLAPGSLLENDVEHFFLANPVWLKPLIEIDDNHFFCVLPNLFFDFIRPIVDELIADKPKLKKACERRRAEYLENEVAEFFASNFTDAEVAVGYKWKEGSTVYENDVIVRIDSHLIVVEAKSGTISWPALRGGKERMQKHVKELFVEPSMQSQRLVERLKIALHDSSQRASLVPNLAIDLDRVHVVLRLSVTLEDFATLQSNLRELEKTGWLPEEHVLAPCILLTDLKAIFEILESEGERIAYLRRRAELYPLVNTIGDEMDHLGLFLKTGFTLGPMESPETVLQLFQMSTAVDQFFAAKELGYTRQKPKLRLTKFWRDICKRIEDRRFVRWSETFCMMLSMSYEEQVKAERMFADVKRATIRSVAEYAEKCVVISIPAEQRSESIAFLALRERDMSTRRERMGKAADHAFEKDHVLRCLVFAIGVEDKAQLYSTMGVFFRQGVHGEPDGSNFIIY